MAKGLPWVGSSGVTPNPRNNFTPWPAEQAPVKAVPVEGDATHQNAFIHESLQGEQHPDMSPIGKRVYR
jgi:hypothetical protein